MKVIVDEKPTDSAECPFCVSVPKANYWGCTLNRDLPCELLLTEECNHLIAVNEK